MYPQPKKPSGETLVLTAHEVAYLLNCSVNRVYLGVRDGTIPHFRAGRRVMFTPEDIQAYLSSLPHVTVEAAKRQRELLAKIAG